MRVENWLDGVGPSNRSLKMSAAAREALVWALGRVAASDCGWLDLETFINDLCSTLEGDALDLYWVNVSWKPEFAVAAASVRSGNYLDNMRPRWLETMGAWSANAILGTLTHLGLIERGRVGKSELKGWCFRLTAEGAAVFGAPERPTPPPAPAPVKFLTVQPNYEVMAYLDGVGADAIFPLAVMARRTTTAGGAVQTFALSRESIYQALELGLSLREIERFLIEHGKTELPANVKHSLAEWGQKRESLTLRTGVWLGMYPTGDGDPFANLEEARFIGPGFTVIPRRSAAKLQGVPTTRRQEMPGRFWHVHEDGRVDVTGEADALTLARLALVADRTAKGWQVTAASVRRARERGLNGEQVIVRLREHMHGRIPAFLAMIVENWSKPAGVFLGELLLLQIPQADAFETIRASKRFQPLLAGYMPPNWFVVHADKRAELEALLAEYGFEVGKPCKLTGLTELLGPVDDF